MAYLFAFVALLGLAGSVHAAAVHLDRLTVGSKTYTNVAVLGANVTDLYFTHDGGINNVKLRYLSPDLQKQFAYDPKAAEEAEKLQAAEDARFRETLGSNLVAQAQATARVAKLAAEAGQPKLADPISDNSLLGKPAPALQVDKWLLEKPRLEHKCVLVFFWAPWSAPCRGWIPALNALQARFREQLVVVGVTSASERDVVQLRDATLDFPCGLDSKGQLSAAAGVTSIPTVWLLDAQGILRYQGHPAAVTAEVLERLLPKSAP